MLIVSCTRYVANNSSTTTSGSGSGTGSGSGSSGGSGSGGGTGSGSGTGTGTSDTSKPAPSPYPRPGGNDTTKPGSGTSGTITNLTIAASSTSPCSPSTEVFTFSYTATGVPANANYEWYFGDGNSATTANPTNTYANSGSYSVILKIVSNGTIAATATKTITAYGQNASPKVSFTAQQGSSANAFTFNNTSSSGSGSIISYLWEFGDGSPAVTGNLTSHTFPTLAIDQTYTVRLTVTGSSGCKISTTQNIIIPAVYTVTGGFSYTKTSPCAPSHEVFTFVSTATGIPSGAVTTWNFGDGNTATGSTANNTYTYQSVFTVVMKVTYNNQTLYTTQQNINAIGQDVTPAVSFYTQSTSTNGASYSYNSTCTIAHGSISSYSWNYGDGNSDTGPFTTHTYIQLATAKTYTVTLTAMGSSGCAASASQTVTVPPR